MSTDEFDLSPETLYELSAELGIDWQRFPSVERFAVNVDGDRSVSGLLWGTGEPEFVFLHGGGQNAHTWDATIALLNRPAIAIDLPGHGHSDWRGDRNYSARTLEADVAPVIEQLAPRARVLVGMSLGGLTLLKLAARRPNLVRRAVIIDVTPGTAAAVRNMSERQRGSVALLSKQQVFGSIDEMVEHASAHTTRRLSPTAVRRGVMYNAIQLPDGSWRWRYDLPDPLLGDFLAEIEEQWSDVEHIVAPMMLVRGGSSKYLRPEDVDTMLSLQPDLRVETVPGAGHSVQRDRPAELAALLHDFAGAALS